MVTFRTPPIPLPNEKCTANTLGVIVAPLFRQGSLRLHDTARLAFIVDPDHLSLELKFPPLARRRDRLQENDAPLPIHHAPVIELGDTGDRSRTGRGTRVEVDDLLVGLFESWWVRSRKYQIVWGKKGKKSKGGMGVTTYVE